jgi:membrane-bound serine protease (ClpP class)
LRPAGKAQINGRRVDVIAQGQMIEQGCHVEVVEMSGGRVVVREIRQTPPGKG